MDKRAIGVFDSGLGGLTVVKELINRLPKEDIVYFGDTARIPYGTRSDATVIKYARQCIKFLLSQDIKMIVIACNTASSISLASMKTMFDIPIIGVIEPGVMAAKDASSNNSIGIIGTQGTIRSGAYEKALKKVNPKLSVYSKACSLFVPLVEEGWADTEIALLTAEKYLSNMKMQDIDTLILGCTHYPLLEGTLSKVMGDGVELINPAIGTSHEVARILDEKGMKNKGHEAGRYNFFASDVGDKFKEEASRFLARDIDRIEEIDIEKF